MAQTGKFMPWRTRYGMSTLAGWQLRHHGILRMLLLVQEVLPIRLQQGILLERLSMAWAWSMTVLRPLSLVSQREQGLRLTPIEREQRPRERWNGCVLGTKSLEILQMPFVQKLVKRS